MKVKIISALLLLAAIGLSCSHKGVDNRKPANDGDISPFVLLPSHMKCQASSEDLHSDLGDVTVSIENGESPLMTINSATDAKLNFKIGKMNVAGGDYSQRRDMDCRFSFDQAEDKFSAVYVCGPKPFPHSLTLEKIKKMPLKSIFIFHPDHFQDETHQVCRTPDSCIELKNCANN